MTKKKKKVAAKSSSPRFKVFEFGKEDKRVCKASKKMAIKYGNPNSDKSPVTKYHFLQCFAPGTKTKQKDSIHRIFDVDAYDEDGDELEVISGLEATASVSANCIPNTCPVYFHPVCSGPGLVSNAARALNHGVTCNDSKHLENGPTTIHLDEDDNVELSSLTSSSGLAENEGIELTFAVFDPNWSERLEVIKSLNWTYKAKWKLISPTDTARRKDACLGNNDVFSSKHCFSNLGESFEEFIYPKGDPDAVCLSKRDIELLRPETFINDTVIDFYIKYLNNKLKTAEKRRFHFFNSFFFRKLADLDKDPSRTCDGWATFQRVHRWTRKVNLFEKDYIFIPINFSLHWSLIVICHPGDVANIEDEHMEKVTRVPCILHMDSIKGSHRGLKNLIRSYLWEEWKERQNQPSEEVSAKFLNLQFVPLELPQQENSFDCGIFLLHYVELFLKQAPVDFSPFKITNLSNFLNKDWFLPAEASLKRDQIKRLIYEIVEDSSQKTLPTPCNDDNYPPGLRGIDKKDTGAEFMHDSRNSPEVYQIDYSSSIEDLEMGSSLPTSTLKGVYCSKEKYSAFRELIEPSAAEELLFDIRYQSVGQMVSLDRLKNVLSPIEEGEEACEQFSHLRIDMAGGQQLGEVTEPLLPAYSDKEFRTPAASSVSVQHMYPEEYEPMDTFSGTSFGRSSVTAEVGERDKYESPSPSSEGLAACVVEDSEEEDETVEVNEAPFHSRRIFCSNGEAKAREKIVVQANNIPSKSELDELAAKRPRLIPPEGRRRLMRKLPEDCVEIFCCE